MSLQDQNGDLQPGKKGLSMNEAQWEAFRENAANVNESVVHGRTVTLSTTYPLIPSGCPEV